ncbi:hypothetical protein ASPCAL01866 [Aspergillus calidoustus]|uniref:beta-glucosidase n=1 Tax=Aspergillus calidoustus TaxID=454130 RepID=A0A0U5GL16_ASPCI|nr:hypothetical protein ASPCAL01866 [Aspergillus calidoustus]
MLKTSRTETDAEAFVQRLTLKEKVALTATVDWWCTAKFKWDGVYLPQIKLSVLRIISRVWEVLSYAFLDLMTDRMEPVARALLRWRRGVKTRMWSQPREILGGSARTGYDGRLIYNGCQSAGVAATPKHFVANKIEKRRRFLTAQVDERALRELFFYPFQLILKHSDPWCFMTSHSRVKGTYTSESPYLIQGILRNEWGFKRLVMSDWVGTYYAAAMNAGLVLEMPGPTIFLTSELETQVYL